MWGRNSTHPSYCSYLHHLWRWNRQSVPKHWHIQFRHRGIIQKKECNSQNMAKVWNQKFVWHTACWEGTAVAQWLRCCARNQKVTGSIPAGVDGSFINIKSFQSHYSPGVDSASKWVPGVFPGGKGGRCVTLKTYHHPVPLSRNLGNNFLEPSGTLRACNGTALPLPLPVENDLRQETLYCHCCVALL